MMMLSSRFMNPKGTDKIMTTMYPREMKPSKPVDDWVKGVDKDVDWVADTNLNSGYHSKAPLHPKETNMKSIVWAHTMIELMLSAVSEKFRRPEVTPNTHGWLGK